MSTATNPFKTIHRDYKRLNRIKALVRLQSNNRSDIIDIFDVYSYRLKELLATVETECANDGYTETTKIRLASIQLALLYDHLDVLMYSTSSSLSKESSTALPPSPKTSIAIINAELERTVQCMQTFHRFRFNDMLSLVYLKSYNLLAKIAYQPLKNFTIARQLLRTAQQMYMEMLEQDKKHPRSFYGWRELFAKSSKLKPTAAAYQFDTIEKLFAESTALLRKIEQIEAEHEDDNAVAAAVGDNIGNVDGAFNSVFDSIQMHQDHSILLGKLLSIIPTLLKQQRWKIGAYFLLVAQKFAIEMAAGGGADEADKTQAMVDVKVQSSIITNWVRYIFGILNGSTLNWRQTCSGAGKLRLSLKFDISKGDENPNDTSIESSPKPNSNFEPLFNCFTETVPLSTDELQFCINSMQTIADGMHLIAYTLKMMKQLLIDSDFHRLYPMDFIIHHYQMSDLLSIATILTTDRNRCFEYQLERFQYFVQMIHTLDKYCPQVYATLVSNFMSDLNEIILDLYAINCDRCVNDKKEEEKEDDDGVGDGSSSNNQNQNQMHDQQGQLIAKLNELHAMTQQFMTSIKPI